MKYLLISVLTMVLHASGFAQQESIVNDAVWYDTDGNEIWNNGGAMLQIGDTFYWVGFKTGGGGGGMAMYSSSDLMNWKNEGNPCPESDFSPYVSTGWMGRPGLFYNKSTNKYIITWEAKKKDWKRHKLGFAVSDVITGPYTFVRAMYGPDKVSFGDMGVYQEGDNAYLVTTVDLDNGKTDNGLNSGIGIYKLSSDFLSIESRVVRFDRAYREAHNIIKKDGVYYWMMSETRGWRSSPTHYLTATSLEGPWSEDNRLKTSPSSPDSYNTQHDFVIPVAGPESTTWLYVGDRYSQHHGIGAGRNIFLPITWDDDVPTLEWRESWTIDMAN
ncbi:family 43 glycosylhydrolase [Draconibacterium sp.]|nr:family 43 glycosylhydrolase [Draconibacterium sp.]